MGFFFSQLKATEGNFHKASNKRIDNCQIPRLAPSIPIFEARKEQVPNLKADCPGSIHQVKKKCFRPKTHLCITMNVLIMYSSSFFVFCSSSAKMSLMVHCRR